MKDQGRTPLRTILQNFLNHVENLDNQKVDGSYEKEFQELKLFSEVLKTSEQYCCSEGQKEVNRKKNRYKDILPFDISRVVLDGYAGVPGSDYINANFIKGASGSLAYIASQGPLPHTVNDFWRMVVECKVQVIVMACNEEEAGKHKCENYWVEEEGQEKQFGMVTVRLVKASVVCPDFLVRTMMLKYTNGQSVTEHRTVCQFHYSAWPDHGVPPLVRPLLDMVRLVRDTQASETLPVLIHCSAGCGRTGTICAIDYVLGLLRAGKLTSDFSLFNLVREMRKQRTAMVQTKEQYVLVHHAVRELFCEQLRMIDSHPYENIDLNGMPLVKETTDSNLEPTYEVIETPCEEKQDIREKEISNSAAPPLPHKKRLSTAASKQEKEVENLTEKQRLASERTSVSEESPSPSVIPSVIPSVMTSATSTQKPRIAKLKAIFERNLGDLETTNPPTRVRHSQQVTRSHSLGAVCKPDLKQLSPSRFSQGETKAVPLNLSESKEESSSSHCSGFQPALPIKRSKSLRVLGSSDQSKLSLVSVGKGNLVKTQKNCGSESVGPGKCVATQQAKDCTVNHKSLGTNISHHFERSERRGLETGTNFNQPSLNSCSPKFSDKPGMRNEQRYDGGQKLHVLTNSGSDRSSSFEFCSTEELKGNIRKMQGMSISRGGGGSSSSSSMDSEAKAAMWPQNRSACQSDLSKTDLDDRRVWKDSKQCATNLAKYAVCQHRNSLSSGQAHSASSIYVKPINQGLYGEIQKKVSSIVTGLGVRERRNSFRQAVSTDKVSGSDTRCVKCESDIVRSKSEIQVRDAKTLAEGQESISRVLNQGDLAQGAKIYSNLSPHSHTEPVHPVVQDERGERSTRTGPPQSHNLQNKVKCSSVKTEKIPVNCYSEVVNRKCVHQRGEEQRGTKPVKESKISPNVCRDEKVSCVMCESEGRNQHRKVESTYSKYSRILPVGRKLSQPTRANHEHLTSSVSRDSSSSGSRLDPQQSHYLHDMKTEPTTSTKPAFPPQTERYDDIVTNRVSSSDVSYHKGFQNKPVPPPSKQKPTLVSKTIRGNSALKNEREPFTGQSSGSTNAQFLGESSTVGSDSVFVKNMDVSQQQTQHVDRLVRRTVCKEREEGSSKLLAAGSQPFASNVPQSSGPDFKKPAVAADQLKFQHGSGLVPVLGQDEKLSARQKHASLKEINRSDDTFSYGLVAGVQLRQGSQDDSACSCPNVAPKVRRHASVVLLRHSLIETAPLSVWSRDHQGRAPRVPNVKPPVNQEGSTSWGTAAGVDVDFIAANMKSQAGKPEASFPRNAETQHLQRHTQHSYPDVPQRTAGAEGLTSPHLVRKQHYL